MSGPSKTAKSPQKAGEKATRLAAALRENLKRRKAQARAKGQPKADLDNKQG
ncbi:hypothetical protein [Reyranella sp.]|uniref:hypothetical protein n=1 Tax=Reyranella sp. TaxID=1929291 RepID=UPI0025D406F5|nr:hypothetical protein [Reyranella sp.]